MKSGVRRRQRQREPLVLVAIVLAAFLLLINQEGGGGGTGSSCCSAQSMPAFRAQLSATSGQDPEVNDQQRAENKTQVIGDNHKQQWANNPSNDVASQQEEEEEDDDKNDEDDDNTDDDDNELGDDLRAASHDFNQLARLPLESSLEQLKGDEAEESISWLPSANSLIESKFSKSITTATTTTTTPTTKKTGDFFSSAQIEIARATNCKSLKDNQPHKLKSRAHCRQARHRAESSRHLKQAASICTRREYREFKLALWHEFHKNSRLLFKYLDFNANGKIEARELWARQKRPSFDRLAINTDDELTYERHYAWNPCALTHLMVFELNRANEVFKLSTFRGAFEEFEGKAEMNKIKNVSHTETTDLLLRLGESRLLSCLSPNLEADFEAAMSDAGGSDENHVDCVWTRLGVNLVSLTVDEHIQMGVLHTSESNSSLMARRVTRRPLYIRDAQLYLSGPFECSCYLRWMRTSFVHKYSLMVTAKPRVLVRPAFQWSLPESRVSFECLHDFIDTNLRWRDAKSFKMPLIEWTKVESFSNKDGRQEVESTNENETEFARRRRAAQTDNITLWSTLADSRGARLELEQIQPQDSGDYKCRVDVVQMSSFAESQGRLIVRSSQANILAGPNGQEEEAGQEQEPTRYLWMFHEGGLSVYKLANEGDLELLHELSGQSEVSGEVDGNWNQLTLCGGLSVEQAVICEWSDNAIEISVGANDYELSLTKNEQSNVELGRRRNYIYIGQPNLNRVIVLDARAFAIVGVVNTEPQPRKLFAFVPNKIHLNKWVRRRLSPLANARWLAAIKARHRQHQLAHPIQLSPKSSRLYSENTFRAPNVGAQPYRIRPKSRRSAANYMNGTMASSSVHQLPARLVQNDIWLLCYGQPLVLDPRRETFDGADQSEAPNKQLERANLTLTPTKQYFNTGPLAWPLVEPPYSTPTSDTESRLRNRKSVQIIQSTFFAKQARLQSELHMHDTSADDDDDDDNDNDNDNDNNNDKDNDADDDYKGNVDDKDKDSLGNISSRRLVGAALPAAIKEFKRLTVITTHYVTPATSVVSAQDYLHHWASIAMASAPSAPDLVQDLSVPQRPQALADERLSKLHYAYVTHFNERQLYRVAMDTYHYDRAIDLAPAHCDPVSLTTALQGLLVIQCRSPITHQLVGQLVLDELTSGQLEFNANIRAQSAYLSPDSKYLVSVCSASNSTSGREAREQTATVIYVQLVGVGGLKLQYEIKTALDIGQCAFVWRDGHYAAVFVAQNKRDRQTELLSLRLADGRLELMVRLPGLVATNTRHREPLNVLPELKIAALTTSEATYIVDLDENRITQTLEHRHHQSSPTLLWVQLET